MPCPNTETSFHIDAVHTVNAAEASVSYTKVVHASYVKWMPCTGRTSRGLCRPTSHNSASVQQCAHAAQRAASVLRCPIAQSQRCWKSPWQHSEAAFAPTHAFVFPMPVFLLTLDRAVAGIPATVIHGFLFAVVTLQPTGQREGWCISNDVKKAQELAWKSPLALTHCFFLVVESSALCFCVSFLISSKYCSLHLSSVCRRVRSVSR